MLFKDLKCRMLLPDDEIIINKHIKIKDKDCIVLGFCSQGDENKLWMIVHDEKACYRDNSEDLDFMCDEEMILSNREQMKQRIDDSIHFSINEIEIQGKKINFCSSTAYCLSDNGYEPYMMLQHFAQRGLLLDEFDEYNVHELFIYSFNQQENEEFPKPDLSRELDIKLHVSYNPKEILSQKSISLDFGDDINEKYTFYDEEDKKECVFYINKLIHYDIWEDANKHFDSEDMKNAIKASGINNEELEVMKKDYFDFVEQSCPKGMDLAMIEYETEDDIQLNFYTREFLDAKPEYKNKSGIFLFSPDIKTGPHGFRNRMTMLKTVKKDFNEKMDFELFSWYKKIPDEIIE